MAIARRGAASAAARHDDDHAIRRRSARVDAERRRQTAPPLLSADPVPSATSAPSAIASSAAAKANVAFVGDPGTRVAVDGTPRGACPVRLALEPGHHDVRFTFDPTQESRGEAFNGEERRST